jgi:SAM-dependent methyltransferase
VSAYIGSELELFSEAHNWKEYLREVTLPFLRGRVLEVGAGIGGTTLIFAGVDVDEWVCVEPDASLLSQITSKLQRGMLGTRRVAIRGDIRDASGQFDAVLYVDVLEHIEDHVEELRRAARVLAPAGRIVVIAPAHQALFSEFDTAVGHFRRYDASSLREACEQAGLVVSDCWYQDSAGLLLSAGNRLLTRQSKPTLSQVMFWDRAIVPLSRRLDRLLRYRVGKTVIAVARAP